LGVKVSLVDSWAKGGEGAVDLAEKVIETIAEETNKFNPIYDYNWTIEQKVETVAKKMYGAKAVQFGVKAKKDIKKIEALGLDKLAICIAKTQKSLSDDPKLKGRPKDFILKIREIDISAGAGFLIPIAGDIMRMPGLPSKPSAELIDIDEEGNITGLF
jgi:formate--tetrahydrofolate ligase